MASSGSENLDGPSWSVRAWPAWARVLAALLVASSRVVPAGVAVAWAAGANFEPPSALAALIGLGLLPAVAARLMDHTFRAEIELAAGEFWIVRDGQRIEVPIGSLVAVSPWRLPLPGAGASLRLRSGDAVPVSLEPLPTSLLTALAAAGVEVPAHPNLAYGAAKHDVERPLWHHPLLQFGLFGLAPTAVLFRAHQIIAYGGLLGQYYLEGLRPYLATLVEYWGITLLYLLLLACTVRLFGEVVALAASWIAPARARSIRVAAEASCAVAFYAGVPALLAIRFLA